MSRPILILLTALLLIAGGCASSSDYQPLTARFAVAAKSAEKSINEIDGALVAVVSEQRKQIALENPKRVFQAEQAEQNCSTGAKGCDLVVLDEDGEFRTLIPRSIIPNHVEAAGIVSDYASALASISNADNVDAVRQGVSRATAAAVNLSSLVPHPGANVAATAFAPSLGEAVVWLYGEYQEKVKVDALKEATARMNEPMARVTASLSTTGEFAALAEKAEAAQDITDKVNAFRAKSSAKKSDLTKLLAQAETTDSLLATGPNEIFGELGRVHAELYEGLNTGEMNFAEALARIETLIGKAKRLGALAMRFKQASAALTSESDNE